MQGIILAAGHGSRLQPITLTRSKAMVPILGKPIVERVMEHLLCNGVDDLILVLNTAGMEQGGTLTDDEDEQVGMTTPEADEDEDDLLATATPGAGDGTTAGQRLSHAGIRHVVVGYGGFLGIGERTIAVPLGAFVIDTAQEILILNADRTRLEEAPEFDAANLPDQVTAGWDDEITSFWEDLTGDVVGPGTGGTATPAATDDATMTPGADETMTPEAEETPAAEETATPGTAAGGGGEEVTIDLVAENIAFDTDTITVPAGARVIVNFTNEDNVVHNLSVYETSAAQNAFFVGDLITGPGAEITYEFDAPEEPGTYYFQCDPHALQMNGEFIVE